MPRVTTVRAKKASKMRERERGRERREREEKKREKEKGLVRSLRKVHLWREEEKKCSSPFLSFFAVTQEARSNL